jgi:hypothetical protein
MFAGIKSFFIQIKMYLFAAAAIAVAIIISMMFWYRTEAISAKAEQAKIQIQLDAAVDANKKAVEAINKLKKQSEIDGRLAADLAAKNRELEDDMAEKDAKLAELEKNDPSVKGFLDTPVPPALSGMYHH